MRKRNIQIKFYLSATEKKDFLVKVEKSKLSQSEFIVRSVLNKKIMTIDGMNEVLVELSRIGNNVNQIARAINKGAVSIPHQGLEDFKKGLENIWQLLRQLKAGNL
jgi:hypothetical protein